MGQEANGSQVSVSGSGNFPRTRWTLVVQAASVDEPSAQDALAVICESYWQPIYDYLRRCGNKPEDSEDLTQGFFAHLITKESLSRARQERGRLRSFLLAALKQFLCQESRRENAIKRGGLANVTSLDHQVAENRYSGRMVDHASPDVQFERSWAVELTDKARERLARDYLGRGQRDLFVGLSEFLSWDKGNHAYGEVASRLGLTETNLRSHVYRMRQRFREALEAEIAETLTDPTQLQDELRHLMSVLRQ